MDQKKVKVKIGGGQAGTCSWKRLNGHQQQNPVPIKGWEMKFELAPNGTISGGNKNDNEKDAQRKEYTGTFKDGILDCVATFEDGAKMKYNGRVEGTMMKIACKCTNGSKKFILGDESECVGPIKYE